MATTLISKPTLSSAFLGQQLSSRGNSKRSAPSGLFLRAPRCAATDTPYGGNIPQFPRVNVWDPYKRLGISRDASEEEVWSSRNFLLNQYYYHERSAESIEAAFEKILMASFINRKKTKINLKTRLKKKVEESPPWVQNLLSFVELPPAVIILRRLFLFGFMACWSVMNSAEAGPAFQTVPQLDLFDNTKFILAAIGGIVVAISFGACVYFLNDKTKSVGRAALIGFGALVAGWFCGSLLVPMIPPNLLQPTWSLELLTSLFIYVSLFLGCTFLK